jgi:hypothetical protein
MKKITTIILLLFFGNMFSQQFSLDNKLTRSFFADETKAPSLDVILIAKIDSDNIYEFTLNYQGNSKIFKLKPLTYNDFEAKLKFNLSDLISSTKDKDKTINLVTKTASQIAIPENSIAFLFTQIVSYYNTEEEKPQVATIYLKEGINVYYNEESKTEEDKYPTIGTLENVSVEISFYGGFIEKIQVNGKINEEEVSFNNKYSIGISSTKNISQLSDNILYSNEKFSDEFAKKIFTKAGEPQINKLKDRESLFINVGDIIRYVKKVDVNANDISPVPQLIILDEKQKVTKLYKEESSKLFEAIVYTDFFGIFDEESPNGIIQTEINKRFNINTKRYDVQKGYSILFPPLLISEGIGFFQSFDASFQYSKIEKNNKFLLPEKFEIKDNNGTIISTENYYSPLSLYQYRSFSIGGNLNLMTLENQNAKLNMYLNVGFLFGRSGIKENETQEAGIFLNNLEIPIEYKFHLLPEKRVSFIFGDRLSWFEVLDSEINLKSIENNELTSKNRWLNSFNIDMNIDISSSGKLFLRYKLIHELDNINNNFSQLQFGYSFYLLQNNGVKKIKN